MRPYLVTVDPAGGDYLSEMCDPREYHVIADAKDLPAALAQLYVVARGEAPGALGRVRPALARGQLLATPASVDSNSGAFSK